MSKDKNSSIIINVGLSDTKIPEKISWKSVSPDGDSPEQDCKAFLLSIFDKESKETLKIDLWTREMQVAEMDRLIYYTLKGLSETYKNATHNTELANEMMSFVKHFGQKTEILKP